MVFIWIYMDFMVFIWIYLVFIWIYLVFNWYLYGIYMDLFGIYMDLFGIYMDLFGIYIYIWIYMKWERYKANHPLGYNGDRIGFISSSYGCVGNLGIPGKMVSRGLMG